MSMWHHSPKPQILTSDQGYQFTSQQYIDFVKENRIRQSMDGKSS